MNIQQAAIIAVKNGKCMTLPEIKNEIKIKPTNDIGNCILMMQDGSHPSKYGWQPSAQDLVRDDWEVID